MQPRKEHKFERDLKGPQAYDRFNIISKICQKYYINLIKAQSIVLILIALLSSISISTGNFEGWIRYSLIGLSIVLLCILIYQQNKNFMNGWQSARFIAESVLSNAWLFSFKVKTYDVNLKEAINSFIDHLEKIEKEVELKNFLSIYDSSLPVISDWMKNLFSETDILKKKSFYIKFRLTDQIEWYSKKSEFNRKESDKWFIISLVFIGLGIILSFIVSLDKFSVYSFL